MDPLKNKHVREFLQHINWSAQQLMLVVIGVFGMVVGIHNFGVWVDVINANPDDPSAEGIIAQAFLAFIIAMGAIFFHAYRKKKYLDVNKPEDE